MYEQLPVLSLGQISRFPAATKDISDCFLNMLDIWKVPHYGATCLLSQGCHAPNGSQQQQQRPACCQPQMRADRNWSVELGPTRLFQQHKVHLPSKKYAESKERVGVLDVVFAEIAPYVFQGSTVSTRIHKDPWATRGPAHVESILPNP